jgi:hypothetical protein
MHILIESEGEFSAKNSSKISKLQVISFYYNSCIESVRKMLLKNFSSKYFCENILQ